MKKLILILLSCFLLSGCWDEVLYKELTIVPLAGLDGKPGKVTTYYSFPEVSEDTVTYTTTEGHGISLRASRNNAFTHTNEMLDISQLEVFLISAEAAKTDLYNTIEVLYRAPRDRLSGKVAIVEEQVSDHFDIAEMLPGNPPQFYRGLLQTAVKFSFVPDLDLQRTAKSLFDEGIDTALPSIRISKETKLPEVSGVALFNGKEFSGHYLNLKESLILSVIKKKGKSKIAQFTYEWESKGKKYPITVEHSNMKKKWQITNEKIDATYQFKFTVEEFPYDDLDDEKIVKEVEKFLSEKMTEDFQKVIDKLQEAKSDAIGFGQNVRAFHPELWDKEKWQDTFSEMDIKIKVEAKIIRSGILN